MFNHFIKSLRYGQKGFTLIELLVVVAILGVLAAVAIPNVAKFIGYGREGVGNAEHREIQNCVVALMAAEPVTSKIPGANPVPIKFGNTTHTSGTDRSDLEVEEKKLSDFITGGIIKCLGHYEVDQDGRVTQLWYPEQ